MCSYIEKLTNYYGWQDSVFPKIIGDFIRRLSLSRTNKIKLFSLNTCQKLQIKFWFSKKPLLQNKPTILQRSIRKYCFGRLFPVLFSFNSMQADYWTQHNLENALFVRKYSQWLGKKERLKSALFESVKEKGSKYVDIRRSGLISLNFHNYFSIVVFVYTQASTSLRRNSPRSLEPVNPLRLSDGGPGVVFHPNSAVPCCPPPPTPTPHIRFLACGRAQPPDVWMINIRGATLAPAGEWMDYVFGFSSRLKYDGVQE